MYLVQIFRASPLMGLALCICLTTILWCFLMAKRQQVGLDKILTGVLGLIAIYEAIRVLKDAGVVLFPGIQKLDGWVDFLIASMYLIAALILKVSSSERISTNARLRLVEANEKTAEPGKGAGIVPPEPVNLLDSAPLAAFAVDVAGGVIYWNPAAERLLGWKRDEVLGQPPPVESVRCGPGRGANSSRPSSLRRCVPQAAPRAGLSQSHPKTPVCAKQLRARPNW